MKNTCSTNWKHHHLLIGSITRKSSGRLLKNTCSTNWKHHQGLRHSTSA
ncbi:hypothetical protein Asd1617_02254 [Shigella dysenteriae 1617]|uniref:Uncharacterized protein n=1 Tax=Shigella dysenteriae 1617 TaxID=754093 RepID=A0A0A6ZTW9_SHIDY|nr:hypothetical protein Asd1617_02254 [Shigella dysenteriae 1617]